MLVPGAGACANAFTAAHDIHMSRVMVPPSGPDKFVRIIIDSLGRDGSDVKRVRNSYVPVLSAWVENVEAVSSASRLIVTGKHTLAYGVAETLRLAPFLPGGRLGDERTGALLALSALCELEGNVATGTVDDRSIHHRRLWQSA